MLYGAQRSPSMPLKNKDIKSILKCLLISLPNRGRDRTGFSLFHCPVNLHALKKRHAEDGKKIALEEAAFGSTVKQH